jgi:hypothetical protein
MPETHDHHGPEPISGVGIGLRHLHLRQVVDEKPAVPWMEVHAENFFKSGSSANALLDHIRADYPLSCHAVGLSLGSASGVDAAHVAELRHFIERYSPSLVSDHVSWSAGGGMRAPDLLPIPYTEEALAVFCQNVARVQEMLGREILVENPSSYAAFAESSIPEWEFITQVAERTGCGLLLDINNIHVSSHNHGWKAEEYLMAIPVRHVKEMHLAGYSEQAYAGKLVLIDSHGARVEESVWALYEKAVRRFGSIPTLIEWDTDIPALSVLLEEAASARAIQQKIARAA